MIDEKLLASSLGHRLKAGLVLDALSEQSPFISLCNLFPGNSTYHNSGSFLFVMKAHSEYKMFSRKLISTACTHFVRHPQVTPCLCPQAHCPVDRLACICEKRLLTWVDLHLYFYISAGVIVYLISGHSGNHFSLSFTIAARQILS